MLGKFFRSKEKEDQYKEDQSRENQNKDQYKDQHIEYRDQNIKGHRTMKHIIEQIVKAVVDNQNDVHINEVDGGRTRIIELKVAKEDIGKVIGKEGRTISAIRTLLASASGKEKVRYVLELLE